MSLLDSIARRLIVVTGKGGVGKTSMAAALGKAYAAKGKSVLLAEVVSDEETPSQLVMALGTSIKPGIEPVYFEKNLSLVLLTPSEGHRLFLRDALPLKILADTAMKSQGLRRFLSAAPGFPEMGIMYRMLDLMKLKNGAGKQLYDVCIIDSPATGHALALAQLPGFLARLIPAGPIAKAAKEGLALLTDEKITGVVVVTLPEILPLTEANELAQAMKEKDLHVSATLINRLPVNIFSAQESAALEQSFSGSGGPFRGETEFRRIARAQAAANAHQLKTPVARFDETIGSVIPFLVKALSEGALS
jgi:arsenite/tail-anchored protein-transporting ATPase